MKLKELLSKYWFILLLMVVILLRLPSLFEPFTYGDEGIYLTLGQAAKHGSVWYRDIHDNKPPMLYLIAAIAGDFSTYRLIHFAWSLITISAFYLLAKLIFQKNHFATIASTCVFGILTSLHTFEGNVGNAENFMLLPTIAGFYLIYEALTGNSPPRRRVFARLRGVFGLIFTQWAWLLAGFLFGIATLFKIPAVFDLAAALVFLFIFFIDQKFKNHKSFILNNLLLISGFLLPILVSFIYYAYHQAFREYLTAAFLQNLPYLSSWSQGKTQTAGLPIMLLLRGGAVLSLIIGLIGFRKKISLPAKLVLTWFVFSWFAALLSARPYPHYLIQILPAFSLSLGLSFPKIKNYGWEVIIPIALALIFRLTFLGFHFWSYPNSSYYNNFYQYALGMKSHQQYFDKFDSQANAIYETANYLAEHTQISEKIFIWGTQPSIYSLAQRPIVGRYSASYHIIDFNGYEQTINSLKQDHPRYILISTDEQRPFPEFFSWLLKQYRLEKQIGTILIYHRIIQ